MGNPNDGNLFLPLDLNFWDDDDILAVGFLGGVLYQHMLMLSKRIKSDGVVSDLQVRKFAIPGTQKLLAALQTRGLVVRSGDSWTCPAYLKRNKSAAEIKETQRLEREGAALGNHRKWHIGEKGKTSPRCDYCTGRLADPNALPDDDPTRVPESPPDNDPESTETETETETEPRTTPETETGSSLEHPPPAVMTSRSRKRPIPEEFQMTGPMMTWGHLHGFKPAEIRTAAAQMLDWHRANGKLMADWDATLRTWLRRDDRFREAEGDEEQANDEETTARRVREVQALLKTERRIIDTDPERIAELESELIELGVPA